MSAAENLMGLIAQLQSMEVAISSIIMESSLKLASLTSASVFIMIETEEARRFTGSPHLINAFLNHSFYPTSKDVQVDVDLCTEIVHDHILQTSPQQHPRPAMHETRQTFQSQSTPSSQRTKTNLKRPITGSQSSVTTPKKQKSAAQCLLHAEVKQEAPDQKPIIDREEKPLTAGSSIQKTLFLSQENSEQLSSSANDRSISCGVSDDDSDVEILENDFSFAIDSDQLPSCQLPLCQPSDVTVPQMKMEALLSIENPLLAFQKGSVECRLLTSVFYDFGKDLKLPETKQFFTAKVNEHMNLFPNLKLNTKDSPLAGLTINVGTGGIALYSPEAFLRMHSRNGFRIGLKSNKR